MEWIKNNLPVITVLLLVLGLAKMAIFFYVFNISILSFLDISEIIQINVPLYIFLLGIICIIGPVSYHYVDKFLRRALDNREGETLDIGARLKNIENKINDLPKEIIENGNAEYEKMLARYIATNIRHVKALAVFNSLKTTLTVMVWTIVIVVAVGISLMRAVYDAIGLKNKSDFEVTMIVNDKPVVTSKNYRFIGRTKSFIFFYDYTIKIADVFSNSEVKGLTFKEGVDYSKLPAKSKASKTASDSTSIKTLPSH